MPYEHKTNMYKLDGEYGIGYTSKGEEFWFDLEDYDLIKDYCWYYDSYGYVVAFDINNKKYLKLHRVVMRVNDPKMEIDHRRHPPKGEHQIDNRKSNLKIVTCSQNQMNATLRVNSTSGVTGVCWHKRDEKWTAYIKLNGKNIFLGYFSNKDDAIKARKEAEIKYYGEDRYDANNVIKEVI